LTDLKSSAAGVGAAEFPAEDGSDRPEGLVADVVAVAVVDGLEIVRVEDDEGEGSAVAAVAGEFLLDPLDHVAAARELREAVRPGHELHAERDLAELALVGVADAHDLVEPPFQFLVAPEELGEVLHGDPRQGAGG
jgi:hypothetical protein